jgi:anti-sigma-K factor RskA
MSEDLHTLVGLYVVDALDEDERDRFEAHLADCAACAHEVAEFRATTGRLSGLMAENPPPALRAAIMDRVSDTRQMSPVDARQMSPVEVPDELAARRSPSRLGRLVPVLAAAAVVVALVLGVGWVRSHQALDRQQTVSAVLTAPDASSVVMEGTEGGMRLVYAPSLDRSVVVVDGMADLPSDRTYALWFIGPDGPEEADLFRTDQGRATRLLERTPVGYAALGVTEEPAGGSPQPTEPILLQGAVDPTI